MPIETTRPKLAGYDPATSHHLTAGPYQRWGKRVLDLALAVAGLGITWPLIVIGAVAIKLESRGPIFFRQRRVGQYGKQFQILKLRTMAHQAESHGPKLTASGDSRITTVGRWLRRAKIDELPQLLNVLRGEMSFVGPRPEVPDYVATYSSHQSQVLNTRPGLTGPASLAFIDEERILASYLNKEEFYMRTLMPLKLDLDLDYCRKTALLLDAKLILLTLARIFYSPKVFFTDEFPIARPGTALHIEELTPLPQPEAAVSDVKAQARTALPFLKRWSLHPFYRDITLTAATEFIILVTGMILVSLFGKLLGPVALAEYLLVRRVASGLQPTAQLGLGVALPRYVAQSTVKSAGESETYFLAALACLLASAAGLGALFCVNRDLFARWLFGSEHMAQLMIALSLLLLGWAMQVAVYGYYRGRLQMGPANLLQFCAMSLVPLAVVFSLFRTHSVAFLVGAIGLCTMLCAALFAMPIIVRAIKSRSGQFIAYCTNLLRYGVVRVPGTLAMSGFFALGPIIAAHYVPMTEVSYFLIGMSILSAVGYCGAPLGIVILSKATMMLVQNRQAEIRKNLGYLVSAVTEISFFVCLQLLVFADVVIRAWVGERFLEGTLVIRLLIAGIPFYLFIIALRSVVDAMTWKPYNTRNVLFALALFLALVVTATRLTSGMLLLQSIAGALVVSLALFAFLTGRIVERLYDFRLCWRQSLIPMILNLLLGGAAVLSRVLWGTGIGLEQVILLEMCFALLFVGVLAKRGSPWLIRLWNTALPNRLPMKA